MADGEIGDVPHEITQSQLDDASVLTGEYYGESSHNGDDFPEAGSNQGSEKHHRYSHYRAWVEKKMEARRMEEEQQLTFKPKLHEYKGSAPGNPEEGTRFDKLYKDAKKRHLEAKVIKAHAEEPQGSFQPQLVTRSSSRGKRAPSPQGIHQRLHAQTGAGNLKSVQADDHPFHPAITRKALEISRNQSVDIADRLFQKSFELKDKQDKKRAEAEAKQHNSEECTFSPKLPSNTRSLSASRAKKSVSEGETPPKAAADRLLKYEEQKKARLEMLRQTKMEVESSEITFAPNLKSTHQNVAYKSSNPNQTVYDRLQAVSKKSQLPDNPECTFKPTISKNSRDMTV
jgi:bifunctional DNA-binding transcriptional regulator/antitoxin component of YhaV-PrlF toxin-antitoxin module